MHSQMLCVETGDYSGIEKYNLSLKKSKFMHTKRGYQNVNTCYLWVLDY